MSNVTLDPKAPPKRPTAFLQRWLTARDAEEYVSVDYPFPTPFTSPGPIFHTIARAQRLHGDSKLPVDDPASDPQPRVDPKSLEAVKGSFCTDSTAVAGPLRAFLQLTLTSLLPVWLSLSFILSGGSLRLPLTLWLLAVSIELVDRDVFSPILPWFDRKWPLSRSAGKNKWLQDRWKLLQPGIFYSDPEVERTKTGKREFGSPPSSKEEKNASFIKTFVHGWKNVPDYETEAPWWLLKLYRVLFLTTGDILTLIPFILWFPEFMQTFYRVVFCKTRKDAREGVFGQPDPYQYRTWVKVVGFTEGEEAFFRAMGMHGDLVGALEASETGNRGMTSRAGPGSQTTVASSTASLTATSRSSESPESVDQEEDCHSGSISPQSRVGSAAKIRHQGPDAAFNEAVAVDWAFPDEVVDAGHPKNSNKKTESPNSEPLRLVVLLHGLNGGSREKYVLSLANHLLSVRNPKTGAPVYAVCCVVARGFMDAPLNTDCAFHGARTTDAGMALQRICRIWRRAGGGHVFLCGFSMGAMTASQLMDRLGRNQLRLERGELNPAAKEELDNLSPSLKGVMIISGTLYPGTQMSVNRALKAFQPLIVQKCFKNFGRYPEIALRNETTRKARAGEGKQTAAALGKLTRARTVECCPDEGKDRTNDSTSEFPLFGHPLRRDFHAVDFAKVADSQNILDLDAGLIAPFNGFGKGMRGAANYYRAQRVFVQNVQMCPVLGMTALDDPLVRPESYIQCVTAEEEPDSDLEEVEEGVVPGPDHVTNFYRRNVKMGQPADSYPQHRHKFIGFFTRAGGHVGWPLKLFDRKGWSYQQRVAESFFERCAEMADWGGGEGR